MYAVPVTAKGKIESDGNDGEGAPLEVAGANANNGGIIRQEVDDVTSLGPAQQGERQGNEQRDQQAFVQRTGDQVGTAFAFAPGDHRLHPGTQAHDQSDGHKVGIAAKPDTGERLTAQTAHHGGVNQI